MADAVFWQLLASVQTRIRALTIVTESGDTVPAFKDAAVVIRKKPYDDDDAKHDRSEETPGVLIAPLEAISDPMAGTNARDDTDYVISVQIIARDSSFREENMKTFLKWQQQIRKLFQSAPDVTVQGDEGIVNIGNALSQNPVVSKFYPVGKYFVAQITLRFIARETRGVTT